MLVVVLGLVSCNQQSLFDLFAVSRGFKRESCEAVTINQDGSYPTRADQSRPSNHPTL